MEASRGGGFRAVVMGASAGGHEVIGAILGALPARYPLPILIAQHLPPDDCGAFAQGLSRHSGPAVTTPMDKTRILSGTVYVAPANYHMLCEREGWISLSVEPKVNWSRPSIDVLFESAAQAWGHRVIGILLTGSNGDGAVGLLRIMEAGGVALVQDPVTAPRPEMPRAAIEMGAAQQVLPPDQIARWLAKMEV